MRCGKFTYSIESLRKHAGAKWSHSEEDLVHAASAGNRDELEFGNTVIAKMAGESLSTAHFLFFFFHEFSHEFQLLSYQDDELHEEDCHRVYSVSPSS